MTAYQMLHRTARVERGESVLVHGAAGRVGTAALELGRAERDSACTGPRQLATAPRSSGSGRLRSTTRTRTSWHACVNSPATVSTSCSTASVVRWRCAPSGHCGAGTRSPETLGETGDDVAPTTRWSTGARACRGWLAWYPGMATVIVWGLLSPADESAATGSRNCGSTTRTGSATTSSCCLSCSAPTDPPSRGRAAAAIGGTSRSRAARAVSGEGKAVLVP